MDMIIHMCTHTHTQHKCIVEERGVKIVLLKHSVCETVTKYIKKLVLFLERMLCTNYVFVI